MKVLFVSNSPTQSVITIHKELGGDTDFEVHLYNHDGGYTERWSVASSYEDAAYYHKQLCMKCYIKTNM